MSKNNKTQTHKRKKLASTKALGKQKTMRASGGDISFTKVADKATP